MNHHQVIIIGAGVSGLAACAKLFENGYKDVLLLEASNRIGGRINTISFQNSFIELGAQWIHGTKSNSVYELAKSLSLVDEKKIKYGSTHYASQNGEVVDEDYVEKIFDKIENIFDNLEDFIENELEDSCEENLGALLDDSFVKFLKKMKKNEQNDIELIKAIYRARLSEEFNEIACDDLRKVSAIGWNAYEDFDGEKYARLKFGYGKIIEFLVSQLPKEAIKLNEIVQKIEWPNSNKDEESISVMSLNTQTKTNTIFTCDYLLCTVSLGYLKKHHYNIFVPHLPLNKIKAIENLGFGVVNKLFVCFEDPVFKKNYDGMKILWRDDLAFKLDKSDSKWNLQGNKFYKSIDNFEVLPNLPNVLICFVVGRDALFIETLDSECLTDVVAELFEKCFPHLNIPRPQQVISTKWSIDPFANGSYSFIKTGSCVNDVKAYAQPINNRLFFAGEATSFKHIGTVNAAYISGRESASKIIKNLKN